MKNHSIFVKQLINKIMEDLSEQERELIEAIRLLKKTKHNYSQELEWWVRELFENLIYD